MNQYTISTKDPHNASVLLGIAEILDDEGKGLADIERVGAALANLLSLLALDGVFRVYAKQQLLVESPSAIAKWKLISRQCRMLGDSIDEYFVHEESQPT